MNDERNRVHRQLEALTLAARDFAGRAHGAHQRADDIAAGATQLRSWAARPPDGDSAEHIAGLPDPPTARMLAHLFRTSSDWAAVIASADDAAATARADAAARTREHDETEALRQAARARLSDIDGNSTHGDST